MSRPLRLRGRLRREAARILGAAIDRHWPPYSGVRDHAYRALVNAGLPDRLVAEAAGVCRRTVRAALAVPYPVPPVIGREADIVVAALRREVAPGR